MPQVPKKSARRPGNAAEGEFWDLMTAKGWELTRRGWPDFCGWHPEHGFIVVEVKPKRGYRLKWHQNRVMRALAKHGVAVYRWDREGFLKITPELD